MNPYQSGWSYETMLAHLDCKQNLKYINCVKKKTGQLNQPE